MNYGRPRRLSHLLTALHLKSKIIAFQINRSYRICVGVNAYKWHCGHLAATSQPDSGADPSQIETDCSQIEALKKLEKGVAIKRALAQLFTSKRISLHFHIFFLLIVYLFFLLISNFLAKCFKHLADKIAREKAFFNISIWHFFYSDD